MKCRRQSTVFMIFSSLALLNGQGSVRPAGCVAIAAGSSRPTDVTSRTTSWISGLRLDRRTGHFVGEVAVRNDSASPLEGPVSLVVVPEGNVQVVNAAGSTCFIHPLGNAFVDVPLYRRNLSHGEVIKSRIEFANPDRTPIRALTRVVVGMGTR